MYEGYILFYILFAAGCYFISNFNFAILLSKRFKHVDIRTQGSGNPGTTNMFRVFGLKLGAPTFILDAMKGVVCAGAGLLLFNGGGEDVAMLAAYIGGFSAGLGHVFPVFYRFNGGKGVACGLGFFLVVSTFFMLPALFVGIIILILTDRMSIFSLLLYTAVVIWHIITAPLIIYLFVVAYWTLVFIAHRENIKRLLTGKESKLGLRQRFFGRK